MSKSLKFLTVLILLSIVLVALYFFNFFSTPIEVVSPAKTKLIDAVYASGTVEPVLMLPIAPPRSSRLIRLHVDEGTSVNKGDLIAEFENPEFKDLISELEAREDLAKKEFERQKKLLQGSATTIELYDKAKLNLEVAKAEKNKANSTQRYYQLHAPQDGKIIRREGEEGEFIQAGEPVFWFSGSEVLRAALEVDEEDISRVKLGQDVLISADAFPDLTFKANIDEITPKGDPASRSFRVRAEFKDAGKLMIGMSVEANIIIKKVDNALIIPETSVSDSHVWLVSGSKLKKTKVKQGIVTPEGIEIISGIEQKDLIVFNAESQDLDLNTSYKIKTISWPQK